METNSYIITTRFLLLMLILVLPSRVFSQNFPNPEQDIFLNNGISSVIMSHLSDLDNDGDLDTIISYPSGSSNSFIWLENIDGLGTYGSQQIIMNTNLWMNDIYTGDLNGDGKMDIITASLGTGDVYWFEHLNGQGNFGPPQIIAPNEYGASSVYAVDIDNDGDLDVLSASFLNNRIAWYENTDGQGNFGPQQIIITSPNHMRDVYAADIDGDGDFDVLSASRDDNRIAWYENTDGQGNFGPQQTITTAANEALIVYAADMDGDQDMDVISGSYGDNRVAWYENTDGQGNFGSQQIIYDQGIGLKDIALVDLDGDNDLDIVSSYHQSTLTPHEILWHENNLNCSGTFAATQVIDSSAFAVFNVSAGDIDNDGDMDIMASYGSSIRAAWYENISSPSTPMYLPEQLSICNENFVELCGPPNTGCGLTYNWYYNDPVTQTSNLVSDSNPHDQCYTPDQYGTYTLVIEDEDGSFSTYTIEVLNPLPQPVLGLNGEICKGDLISIAGQGFDNTNYEITWFYNGTIVQQGGTTLTSSFDSGTITVEISNKECKGGVTTSVEIKECCPDDLNLAYDCKNQKIYIANFPTNLAGVGISSWSFNGSHIAGQPLFTSSFDTSLGEGIYEVTILFELANGEQCRFTGTFTYKKSLKYDCDRAHRKNNNLEQNEFIIYPNPSNDIINLKMTFNSGTYTITNLQGSKVIQNLIRANEILIDISKLNSGVYFIQIQDNRGRNYTKKIIKK